MANTYYVKLDEISSNDVKLLTGTTVKPADKVMVLLQEGVSFSADELMALNGISASIEFIRLESEADLYFYLGMNYKANDKSVFLSGINIPENKLKAMNAGTEKKKRAPKKKQESKPAKHEYMNPPEKDSAGGEDEEEKADNDKVEWMRDGSEKYFSDNCGVPEDMKERDKILDFAAKAFSRHFKVSEAINEISQKYGDDIAEYFKKSASALVLAFDKAALKQVDV